MRIGFLVGDIVLISGGSNVILEYARAFQSAGHDVRLITGGPPPDLNRHWHPATRRLTACSVEDASEELFDFVFATWWPTVFDLGRLTSRVYGYFNQSVESRFHPERHNKLLNRLTYSLPLLYLTEARWIAEYIGAIQPEAKVLYVRNGLSTEFFPLAQGPIPRGERLRVLVEGPWGVAFKKVPETFALLQDVVPELGLHVGWLTGDSGGARPRLGGKPVEVYEKIPIDQVRHVLRQYDVLIKLSSVEGMFGPPLEMFSQGGTAICSTVTGSEEYVVHGANGLLVEPYNQAQLPRYLRMLAENPDYLGLLKEGALATARSWPKWQDSTRDLEAMLGALHREGYSNANLRAGLQGLAVARHHWLGELSNWSGLGQGEQLVIERVRRLLRGVKSVAEVVPAPLRGRAKSWAKEVLR